jgi:hypothetical protein
MIDQITAMKFAFRLIGTEFIFSFKTIEEKIDWMSIMNPLLEEIGREKRGKTPL